MERVYTVVVIRLMRWIVRAKSGTSLERAMSRRIGTTLGSVRQVLTREDYDLWDNTNVIRLSSIQQRPNVHPVVTSARRLCQSNNRPAEG